MTFASNLQSASNSYQKKEVALASEGGRADAGSFQASAKWSRPVLSRGFTVVPNLLLTHQSALGLPSLHCLLLIHLMTYWWESGKNPYPSKAILAQRMGVSERQIQRYISDLIAKGFIRRRREELVSKGGRAILSFDLTGLVEKLKKLESAPPAAEEGSARRDNPASLVEPA